MVKSKLRTEACLKLSKLNLRGAKSACPEELPNILWAYRTTIKVPIGETPFRLTFGTEAVILVEVGLTNIKIMVYKEQRNH